MSVAEPTTIAEPMTRPKGPVPSQARANFAAAGLNFAMVESLILKFLLNIGVGFRTAHRRGTGPSLRPVSGVPPQPQESADRGLYQFRPRPTIIFIR